MWDRIINGIISNWLLVGISLGLLVFGTIHAYQKFGLKRVLLGKKNDDRELIYRTEGSIDWKPTLKTWLIIITGGMNLLSVFLLIMLLALAFIYQHDIQATRDNDELLCQEFGTVRPTEQQLIDFYDRNDPNLPINITIKEINDERGAGNPGGS